MDFLKFFFKTLFEKHTATTTPNVPISVALTKEEIVPVLIPEPPVFKNEPTIESTKIYQVAKESLGHKLSPIYTVAGCVEAVNNLSKMAYGYVICDSPSTTVMYKALKADKRYIEVKEPVYGDIIISPTGYGNGKLEHGHVGIYAKFGIMSNDSPTLKWKLNFTLKSWTSRYVTYGGFPIFYFRKVA